MSLEEKVRRVLMITDHFPPLGGPGVQRITKLVKYLARKGWQPTILTMDLSDDRIAKESTLTEDETLLKDVPASVKIYRTKFFDILSLLLFLKKFFLCPFRVSEKGQFLSFGKLKIKRHPNEHFLIPDRNIGWLPVALLQGLGIVWEEGIDILFATSPNQTSLLIGYALKMATRRPLVVEFRDLWTQNPWKMYPNKLRRRIEERLERGILSYADKVIFVSEHAQTKMLNEYGDILSSKTVIISNGFDPDDFADLKSRKNTKFTITSVGTFYSRRRPGYFLEAISELLAADLIKPANIKLVFVGLSKELLMAEIAKRNLDVISEIIGYVPHRDAIQFMMDADVLLLVPGPGKGFIPGKLYEYLGSGTPILALTDEDTESAQLVKETGAGMVVPPQDVQSIKRAILRLYAAYCQYGHALQGSRQPGTTAYQKYSRWVQADMLAGKFEEIVERAKSVGKSLGTV